jgi:hypothetical protein
VSDKGVCGKVTWKTWKDNLEKQPNKPRKLNNSGVTRVTLIHEKRKQKD